VFRSRLIRTAVKLSLIVALMIQPGGALIFANQCGDKASAGAQVSECGCCQAAVPERQGGCCSRKTHVAAARSCCGDAAPSSQASDSQACEDGRSGAACSASACSCGFRTQPLADTAPSRLTVLPRELLVIQLADLLAVGDPLQRPRPQDEFLFADMLSAHFAQVQFGNWRL